MADKVPRIVESALENGGKRTVLSSYLAPGATTFPHYHTLFTERFTLRSGSFTVYMSKEGSRDPETLETTELQVGESATVPIGFLHKFLTGESGCTTEVTFEPGAPDFERAMLIMCGAQQDGVYQTWGHGADEENALFLAVMSDLTNTHAVGRDAEILAEQLKTKGAEIGQLKSELLQKYATDRLREGSRRQGLGWITLVARCVKGPSEKSFGLFRHSKYARSMSDTYISIGWVLLWDNYRLFLLRVLKVNSQNEERFYHLSSRDK